MSSLREQLARFHGAITGASSLDSARELVERGDIDELERLHVYEHAYTARIAGVLVADYPKLAKLVGEPSFRSWTADYLRAFPPASFSLREVGANLARWIESRDRDAPARIDRENARHLDGRDGRTSGEKAKTVREDGGDSRAGWADLARLERARIEVFDGPDSTPLARDDLATLDPAEFPSLKLHLVPSSRVVTLATNADDVWDAIENELEIPSSSSEPRTVLVWRREYKVLHRTLEPDEARMVPTMLAGTTFGAACELFDEDAAPERAIELLVRWLDAAILRS